jgi:hypothetical protein
MYSTNRADLVRFAYHTLAPLIEACNAVFVIRGTEAHTGGAGELEELLAKDISNIVPFSKQVKSHWHLRQIFGGVRFDIAHHASMGGRPWTQRNAGNQLAALAAYDSQPPKVIVRSHVHRWSDSGHNFPTFACTLPGWELPTAYSYRIGSTSAEFGGVVFKCGGGAYSWEHQIYEVRTAWQEYKVK